MVYIKVHNIIYESNKIKMTYNLKRGAGVFFLEFWIW
jgi:hypothetical protein